jgi:hypothetical protein
MTAFQNRRFLNLTSLVLILNATDSAVLFDRAKAAVTAEVKLAEVAPASGKNSYYIGNRSPLLVSPFIKLPIGAITPKGWLHHQLALEAQGMTGRLPEISKWCKFEGNAWASPDGQGHSGWEELPYWLKGYGDLGYVLNDKKIIQERANGSTRCSPARSSTVGLGRARLKRPSMASPISGRTWSCSTCFNPSTNIATTSA